ncbi:MAG: hypothetical protein mread185_000186 [Mycoplasmataceae bacterium]|nr:MAG: hypothetical protein mread185_000186 [Mycoplasmataceae bacterium]
MGLNPGPCLSSTLSGKSYCQEHQKDFECRGCKKELETSPGGKERFYKVIKTFEDKEDNFWKESDSFSLCSCCWEQKKEDLKKDLKKKYIPVYEEKDEIKKNRS